MTDAANQAIWILRRARQAALLGLLILPGCTEGPPSCRDRLVGQWESVMDWERDWEPEGKRREPVLFVMYWELNEDGTATRYMNYEHPDRRGREDRTAPPILNFDAGTWDIEPPQDPSKVECRFFIDNDDIKPFYADVKFESADRFVEVGASENVLYTRVPAARAKR